MKGKGSFKKIVFGFILAFGMFYVLLQLEKQTLNEEERVTAIKVISDIKSGTMLSEDMLSNYFQEVKVNKELTTESTISDISLLKDMYVTQNVYVNELMNLNDVLPKNEVIEIKDDMVEIGIDVEKLSQSVGGTLREGDFVDIYVVDNNTYVSQLVLRNVYISKAFASDGTIIPKGNNTSSTMTFNIYISSEDANRLNEKCAMGTIRLSKIN